MSPRTPACFRAGTPQRDAFAHPGGPPPELAPEPFVSEPQARSKYAALSANLASLLEELSYNDRPILEAGLARVWTERNDAQNYVVLGDPAASLKAA
jgi:hypothetical protein